MNSEPRPITFPPSTSQNNMLRESPDFSLVLGGPLFQLLRRSHMSGDALELMRRRIIIIPLLAWLPSWCFRRWKDGRWAGTWPFPSCWTWKRMPAFWWRCRC